MERVAGPAGGAPEVVLLLPAHIVDNDPAARRSNLDGNITIDVDILDGKAIDPMRAIRLFRRLVTKLIPAVTQSRKASGM